MRDLTVEQREAHAATLSRPFQFLLVQEDEIVSTFTIDEDALREFERLSDRYKELTWYLYSYAGNDKYFERKAHIAN